MSSIVFDFNNIKERLNSLDQAKTPAGPVVGADCSQGQVDQVVVREQLYREAERLWAGWSFNRETGAWTYRQPCST